MARPVNPTRKSETLARATDYVLEHGLAGLSLRPLAKALGTSPRMLLYDFESKEQLIAEILAEARRREAALLADFQSRPGAGETETLRAVWDWISADERRPFLRLFFQVYVDAIANPEAYAERGRAMVTDWLELLQTEWRPRSVDAATATLMIAVVRGLLLDRLNADDPERTDDAFARFTALVSA